MIILSTVNSIHIPARLALPRQSLARKSIYKEVPALMYASEAGDLGSFPGMGGVWCQGQRWCCCPRALGRCSAIALSFPRGFRLHIYEQYAVISQTLCKPPSQSEMRPQSLNLSNSYLFEQMGRSSIHSFTGRGVLRTFAAN